jgi:hypothetical protein
VARRSMIGLGRGEPEQPGEIVGDTFVMTLKDLPVGQVQQVRCEFANRQTSHCVDSSCSSSRSDSARTRGDPASARWAARLTAVSVLVSFAGVRRRPSLITFGPKPRGSYSAHLRSRRRVELENRVRCKPPWVQIPPSPPHETRRNAGSATTAGPAFSRLISVGPLDRRLHRWVCCPIRVRCAGALMQPGSSPCMDERQ